MTRPGRASVSAFEILIALDTIVADRNSPVESPATPRASKPDYGIGSPSLQKKEADDGTTAHPMNTVAYTLHSVASSGTEYQQLVPQCSAGCH